MLIAALLLFAACGGDDNGSDAAGGDTDKKATEDKSDTGGGDGGGLTFTAVDYGFQGPTTLPAGKAMITLENEGKEPHELVLVQLLQGKTIEDVKAFIKENGAEGKPPKWVKFAAGVRPVKPGKTGTGGGDLKPGNYIAVCFVPSKAKGGKPHVALGMIQPLTVE